MIVPTDDATITRASPWRGMAGMVRSSVGYRYPDGGNREQGTEASSSLGSRFPVPGSHISHASRQRNPGFFALADTLTDADFSRFPLANDVFRCPSRRK